jgi:hypothetical protein
VRGVDRSSDSDNRDIVRAEESREGRVTLVRASCQSYQTRLRPSFALYQNKDRGRKPRNVVLACKELASKMDMICPAPDSAKSTLLNVLYDARAAPVPAATGRAVTRTLVSYLPHSSASPSIDLQYGAGEHRD